MCFSLFLIFLYVLRNEDPNEGQIYPNKRKWILKIQNLNSAMITQSIFIQLKFNKFLNCNI